MRNEQPNQIESDDGGKPPPLNLESEDEDPLPRITIRNARKYPPPPKSSKIKDDLKKARQDWYFQFTGVCWEGHERI